MGWQDAPVVGSWQDAPLVEDKTSTPTNSVLSYIKDKAVSVARPLAAYASGVNRTPASILGMPMDLLVSTADLLKIPVGVAYHELTGKDIPKALSPYFDRSNIPGTQAAIEKLIAAKVPGAESIMTGNGAASEYPTLHAMGLGTGTTMALGRPQTGIQAVGQGALGAASAGAGQATYEYTKNPALGVAASLAVPTALFGGSELARMALKPSQQGIANAIRAEREGIPVGLADVTDSNMMRSTRSVLNDVPLARQIGIAQGQNKQSGFNRAVGRTFGSDAGTVDAETIANQRARLGGEFDRIWNNNDLVVNRDLRQTLNELNRRTNELPRHEAMTLTKQLDDFKNHVTTNENGVSTVPGSFTNAFQSSLRRMAEGRSGTIVELLNTLRRGVIDAFNQSVSPEDAASLTTSRSQYKNLKTVSPLVNEAELNRGGTPGDIPAARLPGAVIRSFGKEAMLRENSPRLGQIASVGNAVVPERVLQTGGSPRSVLQNLALLTGFGLAGATGIPGIATGLAGSAALNYVLGSPGILKWILEQPDPALAFSRIAPVISEATTLRNSQEQGNKK